MPAIGDQVASLEHDHADALAKIDSLTAANAALTNLLNSLTTENAALHKYADEIKAMVESVAGSALKMLQAAQAPIAVVKVAETAVADVEKAAAEGADALTQKVTAIRLAAAEHVANLAGTTVEGAILPPPPNFGGMDRASSPYWKNTVAGDSGDEQPTRVSPPPSLSGQMPQFYDDHAAPVVPPHNGFTQTEAESIGAAATKWGRGIAADLAAVPEAVERMLHHSSASSTQIRRPVDLTMHVDHTDEGLPMFLRKGTAFDALARTRGYD